MGDQVLADKLVIIMVNTDPRNGEELGAPFFQATVAAAMDYEVEVVCTATAVAKVQPSRLGSGGLSLKEMT